MKFKLKICVLVTILLIGTVLQSSSFATNLLDHNKKAELDMKEMEIQKRYREVLKKPLTNSEDAIKKHLAEGEQFKADQKKIYEEKIKYGYIDNIMDTKDELIKEIDLNIHVIDNMINSSYFDTSVEKDRLESDRAKEIVKELINFKEKVLKSDNSSIQSLIDEYTKTLKYKKIRIE